MATESGAPAVAPVTESEAKISRLLVEIKAANERTEKCVVEQEKTRSCLEAEMKRTATLKELLDSIIVEHQRLGVILDGYKKLSEESIARRAELIWYTKVKQRFENWLLVLGGLAVPAGMGLLLLRRESSGAGDGAGALFGLAISSAGAATLLTMMAIRALAPAEMCSALKATGAQRSDASAPAAGGPS